MLLVSIMLFDVFKDAEPREMKHLTSPDVDKGSGK